MKANEYQELALRTAASMKRGDRIDWATVALGLVGESGELLSAIALSDPAPAQKEAGDCWWYVAVIAYLLEEKLEQLLPAVTPDYFETDEFLKTAAALADTVKKFVGHGHELNSALISGHLRIYIQHLCVGTWEAGFVELEDAWTANIEKLRKRYPQGFTTERSINREDAS